jgi:hypothetical protein
VVERILGKAEVVSSILTGSTSTHAIIIVRALDVTGISGKTAISYKAIQAERMSE